MDRRNRIRSLALIAVGGFLGAASRHVVAVAFPAAFPWGTLLANVTGAFLLGLLLYEAELLGQLSADTRLLAGTGFCSSFTTYSTFAVETTQLSPQLAALNVGANYVLGLLAVVLGQLVVRWAS